MYAAEIPTRQPLRQTDLEFPTTLLNIARRQPHVHIEERLSSLEQENSKAWEAVRHVYIKQRGQSKSHATTATFDLEEETRSFLKSEKKVLLIRGDAGAGKSTFTQYLTRILWMDRENAREDAPIPLLIRLPFVTDAPQNLVPEYLKRHGFYEADIHELKQGREFVFILDGYDEISKRRNLYNTNQLHEWKARVVITCRTEYLNKYYHNDFIPERYPDAFLEFIVAPFSRSDIQKYIKQHVGAEKHRTHTWNIDDYNDALKRVPSLTELLSNTFILCIAMEALPA